MGPEQFSDEKLQDPRVRALVDKVVVEVDPELDKFSAPGIVEIITNNGQRYRCEVLQPKGHPMNPMTDADVEEKFRSMAGKFMGEQQMKQIVDTVYNLESSMTIGTLVKLLVACGADLLKIEIIQRKWTMRITVLKKLIGSFNLLLLLLMLASTHAVAASPALLQTKQEAEAKGYFSFASHDEIVAMAKKEGKLVVITGLESPNFKPLINRFKQKYPFFTDIQIREISGRRLSSGLFWR